MKSFLKFCLFIPFLALLSLLVGGICAGHKKGLLTLIKWSGKENYTDKILGLITPEKYFFLLLSVLLFLVLLGILIFKFESVYNQFRLLFHKFILSAAPILRQAFYSDLKFLLVIPVLASIYFAFSLPVSYDEAWTYLNFTSKGVISSISYYPAPNNHILHSLLTNFTSIFSFLTPLFCLRISAIVVNLLFLIVTFSFLKKYYNQSFALLVTGICSVLFLSVYYSYMSRGYGLVSLFFMIALYASFNITKDQNKNIDWLWFSVASILGFYTMPSFLYPFFTINLFILLSNKKSIKKQIIANISVIIVVSLLYLPVIIVNGIQAIVNNPYVKPLARKVVLEQLPSFLSTAISDISGISSIFIIILICSSVLFAWYQKERKQLLLIAILIITPAIVLTIHSVIPFSRTFIYYNFILIFLCLLPISSRIQKAKSIIFIPVILLIQILGIYNFKQKIKKYEAYNLASHKIIQEIIGNKKYLCDEDLFSMNLLFELKSGKFLESNLSYFNSVPFNTDTLKGFDYIIIGKPFDKTKMKKAIYETHDYRVY